MFISSQPELRDNIRKKMVSRFGRTIVKRFTMMDAPYERSSDSSIHVREQRKSYRGTATLVAPWAHWIRKFFGLSES